MRDITIDKRHQGPFGTANGGYTVGVLTDAAGGNISSVRLRRPVPVDIPIHLLVNDDRAKLRLGEDTLAETEAVPNQVARTPTLTIDEALAAEHPSLDMGMFADCFVCGRDGKQGLGLRPRPLGDGRWAALWHPGSSDLIDSELVPARYLRSALDCPGGFAVIAASGRIAVTGSLTSRVDFLPAADRRLVVVGEAASVEGRKLHAVTTIFTEDGKVVATAEAIWVTLEAAPVNTAA